jgi:hypothetical protein
MRVGAQSKYNAVRLRAVAAVATHWMLFCSHSCCSLIVLEEGRCMMHDE